MARPAPPTPARQPTPHSNASSHFDPVIVLKDNVVLMGWPKSCRATNEAYLVIVAHTSTRDVTEG